MYPFTEHPSSRSFSFNLCICYALIITHKNVCSVQFVLPTVRQWRAEVTALPGRQGEATRHHRHGGNLWPCHSRHTAGESKQLIASIRPTGRAARQAGRGAASRVCLSEAITIYMTIFVRKFRFYVCQGVPSANESLS